MTSGVWRRQRWSANSWAIPQQWKLCSTQGLGKGLGTFGWIMFSALGMRVILLIAAFEAGEYITVDTMKMLVCAVLMVGARFY